MDNVDNLVDRLDYGKPDSTKKDTKNGKIHVFCEETEKLLCKCLIHEKIHMLIQLFMLINMWIMWITLVGKQVFPNFQHVSGPHSYQQVPVHTFF